MIKIYAQNPNEKAVVRVADVLRSDGVIVYPTDSVYAFGCSIRSPKAIERLRALSGKKGDEFSIVCPDLSTISAYARVDNAVFKVLKRNLPGPFTFVLNASGKVPDKFLEKRKTVGVRIPTTPSRWRSSRHRASVRDRFGQGSETEYTTDPSLIEERYGSAVEAVIDGGYGLCVPTTVVDCTDESDIVVLREGIGELV